MKNNKIVKEQLTLQSRNSPLSCSSCHIQFTGRSLPEICWQCSKYHHKKCLQSKQHACHKNGTVKAPCASSLLANTTSTTVMNATHSPTRAGVLQSEDHVTQTATTTVSPSLQRAPTPIVTTAARLPNVFQPSSSAPAFMADIREGNPSPANHAPATSSVQNNCSQ